MLGSFSVAPLSNTACQLLPGNKEKCPSVCLDFSHSKFGNSNVDSAWILSPRSKEHNFSRTFLFSAPVQTLNVLVLFIFLRHYLWNEYSNEIQKQNVG